MRTFARAALCYVTLACVTLACAALAAPHPAHAQGMLAQRKSANAKPLAPLVAPVPKIVSVDARIEAGDLRRLARIDGYTLRLRSDNRGFTENVLANLKGPYRPARIEVEVGYPVAPRIVDQFDRMRPDTVNVSVLQDKIDNKLAVEFSKLGPWQKRIRLARLPDQSEWADLHTMSTVEVVLHLSRELTNASVKELTKFLKEFRKHRVTLYLTNDVSEQHLRLIKGAHPGVELGFRSEKNDLPSALISALDNVKFSRVWVHFTTWLNAERVKAMSSVWNIGAVVQVAPGDGIYDEFATLFAQFGNPMAEDATQAALPKPGDASTLVKPRLSRDLLKLPDGSTPPPIEVKPRDTGHQGVNQRL